MITRQHTSENNHWERDALNIVRQFSKRDPHLKTFHQGGYLVQVLEELWYYVSGKVKQKFGFIERVDRRWITTVKDLES